MESRGDELCSHVFTIMNHPTPRVLWGSEFTIIYNGPCAALMGEKHPGTRGLPGAVGFAIGWEQLHRNIKTTIKTGKQQLLRTVTSQYRAVDAIWKKRIGLTLCFQRWPKMAPQLACLKSSQRQLNGWLAKGGWKLQTWLRKWTQLKISPSFGTTWLIYSN